MKSKTLLVAILFAACSPAPGCLPSEKNPRYCVQATDCKDPAYPICDVPAKECVASLVDGGGLDLGDMSGDGSLPDLVEPDLMPPPDLMPECTEATVATSCAVDKPVCDSASQTCRLCGGNGDDTACMTRDTTKPYCLMTTGRCVECRDSSQCTGSATKPVCESVSASTKNTCRGCATHDECPSKLCNADGSCEPAANIVYVNNRTPDDTAACTGTSHAGTLADPYCQIGDGITNRGTKQIIRVLGSADEYKVISIASPSATPLRIIGPGSSAVAKATVREATSVTVLINVTGSIDVSLEGLVLGSETTGTLERGVDCKGSGVTLTLQDVVVQKSAKEGVYVDSCLVRVKRSTIIGNAGGLVINTTDYKIENNLIAKNSATGVVFDGSTPLVTSKFWFNTVVRNGSAGVEGGVNCGSLSGANTRSIANSIASGNTTAASTQFNGKCAFASVVAGASEGSSATGIAKTDPPFVDGSTTAADPAGLRAAFSLAATDTTICVDQLDPAAGFPSVDLFGTARPQGAKFDIGAHELAK